MSEPVAMEANAEGKNGSVLARVLRSPLIVLVAVCAGVVCGLYFPQVTAPVTPFAEIYLNLLKMILLPLIVSSVIFAVCSLVKDPGSIRYLIRLVVVAVTVSVLAVAISGFLTLLLQPGRLDDPQSMVDLGQLVRDQGAMTSDLQMSLAGPAASVQEASLFSMVVDLVPSNVFGALASGNLAQVLLFCLLFGLAVGRIPGSVSESLSCTFEAVFRACIVLTEWFNWLLPFALFVLIANQVAAVGLEPVRLMGGFLGVLGLSTLIVMVISVVVITLRARQPFWSTFKACQPLFMTTVATGSSVAAIPWIVSLLSRSMRFDARVIELIVPLQSVLLRAGPIMVYVTGIIFIAQLYGRELSLQELAFIGVASSFLGMITANTSGPAMLAQMGVMCGFLGLPFEAVFVLFMILDTPIHQARTISIVFTVTAASAAIAPRASGVSDTIAIPRQTMPQVVS